MNNCYSVLPKGGFTNEVKKESQDMTPTKIVEKRKTDGKLKFIANSWISVFMRLQSWSADYPFGTGYYRGPVFWEILKLRTFLSRLFDTIFW
jgi:hypothetical protein